jgi:hypothetical protein
VITKTPVRFVNVTKQLAVFPDIFAAICAFEFLNADADASIVRFDLPAPAARGGPSGSILYSHYTSTLSCSADATLVLWLGAAAHLANSQGLGMAVPYWRLIGGHGLYATFHGRGLQSIAFLLSWFVKPNI